jgi:hypothetical protein
VRTRVVPTGLAHFVHFTRHFRAGLSYPAAPRLEFWWCLLHRLRSMVVLTQSLKPASFRAFYGAAEAAPFKNIYDTRSRNIRDQALRSRSAFSCHATMSCRGGFWNHRLPEAQWSCGGHAAECAGEVALVGEPAFGGDLCQRPIGLP